MPELPEVETFRSYLDKTSLNQVIKKITVIDDRVLNVGVPDLKKFVKGKKLESSVRHGKYLFAYLDPGYLILHFGMTGDLEYYSIEDEAPAYQGNISFC